MVKITFRHRLQYIFYYIYPSFYVRNYLKRKVVIHGILLLLCIGVQYVSAEIMINPADSIIRKVVEKANVYEWYIKEYDAEAYVKGTTNVVKKNFLLKYAPDVFSFDKKEKRTIIEALIDMHYESPNRYTQKIKALTGARMKPDDIQKYVMKFLNFNMYTPISIDNQYLMPFSPESSRYYNYYYEGHIDSLDTRLHRIRIEPKWESPKLLSAEALVIDGVWSIAYLEASGWSDFAFFNVKVTCGVFKETFLLPVKIDLFLKMHLLGNQVENEYVSYFDYKSVSKWDEEEQVERKSYDVTEYFNVRTDSVPILKDSLFWEKIRPVSLSQEEKLLYEEDREKMTKSKEEALDELQNKTWNVSKGIFESGKFTRKGTSLNYSGLLNPLKIGYSPNLGISYSQKLKLERHFERNDREVGFYPNVGYLFKRKEFISHLPFNWLHSPTQMGKLSIAVGSGSQGLDYRSTEQIDELIEDSVFSIDNYELYYKDYYAEISHGIEICNGLSVDLGIAYHYREPVLNAVSDTVSDEVDDTAPEIVHLPYRSFTPSIGLTWNPKQYYRMDGKKKIYVASSTPTFSLLYSRGLKGIFESDGNYERIEFDVQQRVPLGPLSCAQYYAGAGVFTNSSELYFVDFDRFTRSNFPESWKDKIGGAFHLLDDYWYYAPKSYVQAHAMYESPFIFMSFMKNISRYVFSERLYVSQLYLPGILPSYTEVGYGVGNFLLNVGVFASFEGTAFQRVGFRFAFELFN